VARSLLTVPAAPVRDPLPLHDALPICRRPPRSYRGGSRPAELTASRPAIVLGTRPRAAAARPARALFATAISKPRTPIRRQPFRSEEHTSELQSRENLVCRLLLEKKKN